MKQNKGITLIALVITIIVLLILAGVSISAIMGENGIATKAQESKEETRAGEVQEVIDLWKTEVVALETYEEWGDVESEDEVLQRLISNKKVKEAEINRTEKTITIGTKVIDYSVNISNPYEIKAFSANENYNNNMITLFNKNTGEYEDFGENVIVEVDGEILDGDVSEFMYIGYEEDGLGYSDNTVIFDIIHYASILGTKYVKITVNKDGMEATWEGEVRNNPPV